MAREFRTDSSQRTVTEADLFEGGDPDVSYTIAHLTPKAQEAIVAKLAARVSARRAMTPREAFLMQTDSHEEMLNQALVGWSGITVDGEPAPCTPENRALMPHALRRVILQAAGVDFSGTPSEVRSPDSFR